MITENDTNGFRIEMPAAYIAGRHPAVAAALPGVDIYCRFEFEGGVLTSMERLTDDGVAVAIPTRGHLVELEDFLFDAWVSGLDEVNSALVAGGFHGLGL